MAHLQEAKRAEHSPHDIRNWCFPSGGTGPEPRTERASFQPTISQILHPMQLHDYSHAHQLINAGPAMMSLNVATFHFRCRSDQCRARNLA